MRITGIILILPFMLYFAMSLWGLLHDSGSNYSSARSDVDHL